MAILVGIVVQDDRIMLITCFSIVVVFIATGAFGRAELMLVGTRLSQAGRKLISPIFPHRTGAWQVSIRLQGSQQWNLLWDAFVESADKLQLCSIRLDVNLPTIHESFHASWERPKQPRSDKCWSIEVPFVINSNPVGRVCINGERNAHSACQDIQQLMELIEPFEARLREIADQDKPKIETKETDLERSLPQTRPRRGFRSHRTTPQIVTIQLIQLKHRSTFSSSANSGSKL